MVLGIRQPASAIQRKVLKRPSDAASSSLEQLSPLLAVAPYGPLPNFNLGPSRPGPGLWLPLSPRIWFLLTTWLWLLSPPCNTPSPILPPLPIPGTVKSRLRRGDVDNRSMGPPRTQQDFFSRHSSLSIPPHGLIKPTPCFLVLIVNFLYVSELPPGRAEFPFSIIPFLFYYLIFFTPLFQFCRCVYFLSFVVRFSAYIFFFARSI